MFHFKRLVEKVRLGKVMRLPPFSFLPSPSTLPEVQLTAEEKDHFYEIAEQAEIFIMPPTKDAASDSDAMIPSEYDMPFKTCCFEGIDPIVIGDAPSADAERILNLNHESESDAWHTLIYCILVNELAPRKYELFISFRAIGSPESQSWVLYFILENGNALTGVPGHAALIVEEWLTMLQTARMGSEDVKEKVKLGSGKAKRTHTIRRVIRISFDKNYEVTRPLAGKTIDWSHRWTVRGTWVTFWKDATKTEVDFSKVGKDRAGDYCVHGYTWRVEHTKGPDDKPLIKKTRIVEN